ncbi:hypothetical protein HYPSUDRAFT_62467 [Hypholoma sublateritium FD-334 SS-4]|uniref:SUZ domain-containing protein n=1 Tax=Hypholoma sublateritium (strain FD-334 SS-4) TaxID=945553 RepID=A0A0D2MVS0_HYPSF|nr:hypothetical protein HYPSUDRAFT_62467 [Hypholoma sublateritium FD-334 SS-4]
MALGTSPVSTQRQPLTPPSPPPDPSPTAPRSDPVLHTAYPDNHPAQTATSPAPAVPNPPYSYMDANIHDDATITSSSLAPNPDLSAPTPAVSDGDSLLVPGAALAPDVDPQILEALRSKDRIYVLKLGETFEALIMERRQRVEMSPATSYQRLLVHRCSAYYRLTPESDPISKGLFVLATPESRIPDRRICELVPAESTAQPAFKIMRRSVLDRRNKAHSHAGSVAGDDQDLSDVEQSESGSLGGRSNPGNKKRMTIEEREAAYNEARSRIFMDFEEKGKDKDMSASSSTLSLNGSASTSAGGRSSAGDTDDAASSPATESEWSVPSGSNSRDKKDGRRGGPGSTSASSTRSIRNGGSFHANGSGGSSRNSRAPSPAFSYASLHDSPMGHIYDPSQPNQVYYANQYAYPYSPPGPGPSPPFMPQYPYYPPYNPYQPPPPMPPHNNPDPTTPSGAEPYSSPHQMNYAPHYGWPPHPQQPPLQSPPHQMQMPLPQQPQQNGHPMGMPPSIPAHSPQYQPFLHPSHGYTYPMNGYYQPPPVPGQPGPPQPPHILQSPPQQQQIPQPQHQQPQQQHHNHHNQQQHQQQPSYEMPRGNMNGNQLGHAPNGHFNHGSNGSRNGLGNGVIPPNNGRTTSRNGATPGGGIPTNGNGAKNGRSLAPPARGPWSSYGPGVGVGYTAPVIPGGGDAMGPRFSNTTRRPSGNSSSGGNSRASPNDDVSSTSSSTTSSSSRRTFTSTTSSQHPLPARPDWAVGLKAQPTLAGARHHDLSHTGSRTMSPISPPRSNGHNSPMPNEGSPRQPTSAHPPVYLQATDFPPLTSGGAAQEKRTPVVAGAWGNSRPVLTPAIANGAGSAAAAVAAASAPGSAHQSPVIRHEENSPKPGDLASPPKIARRPAGVNGQAHQRPPGDKCKDGGAVKGDTVASPAVLAGQLVGMSLVDEARPDGVATQDVNTSATLASLAHPPHEKDATAVASSAM